VGPAKLAPSDARACGGCFHPEDQPETTVVTGHRMAFSISTTQTVLWDQIQYAGNPKDFAWVLPGKPGARIEVANDAWFEALDAATTTRVVAPQLKVAEGRREPRYPHGACNAKPPRAMALPEQPVITPEEVLRIAGLAHLHLSPDEIARMTFELAAILAYVKQLEELDVSAVPATAHVQLERLALRPDEPTPSLPRDLALREAPRVEGDGFAVPAFVDEG